MKTCGRVSSRDKKKKQAESYFGMRAGLRNNEFCLRGLYCRLRSNDGNFKPRRRRMQNLWLYSAKWSHLNKDKGDCRTFQLVKQLVNSWRHLKEGY